MGIQSFPGPEAAMFAIESDGVSARTVTGTPGRYAMTPSDVSAHEEAVIELLRKSGPSSFDNLIRYVPHLSWGEVFVAVDRMSRDGRLLIRRRLLLRPLGSSSYQITLPSQLTSPRLPSHQEEARR
jgi:hypothetical protein